MYVHEGSATFFFSVPGFDFEFLALVNWSGPRVSRRCDFVIQCRCTWGSYGPEVDNWSKYWTSTMTRPFCRDPEKLSKWSTSADRMSHAFPKVDTKDPREAGFTPTQRRDAYFSSRQEQS